MLDGLNKSIDVQLDVFEKIISNNKKLMKILDVLEMYALENPNFKNWYVGAGGVNQTVFNYYHGFEIDYGIKDYDIVYFDSDTSYEAEDIIIRDLEKIDEILTRLIKFKMKRNRIYIYEKKEEPYDKEVCRMIRDILTLRETQASV
mgnify:CR=1 FL=1